MLAIPLAVTKPAVVVFEADGVALITNTVVFVTETTVVVLLEIPRAVFEREYNTAPTFKPVVSVVVTDAFPDVTVRVRVVSGVVLVDTIFTFEA